MCDVIVYRIRSTLLQEVYYFLRTGRNARASEHKRRHRCNERKTLPSSLNSSRVTRDLYIHTRPDREALLSYINCILPPMRMFSGNGLDWGVVLHACNKTHTSVSGVWREMLKITAARAESSVGAHVRLKEFRWWRLMTLRFAGATRIPVAANSCVICDPYPVWAKTYVAPLALSMGLNYFFFFISFVKRRVWAGGGSY